MSSDPMKSRIMGAIRKIASYSPGNIQALELAKSHTEKGKRGGAMFNCARCGLAFPRREVQIDHIDPVIPLDSSLQEMDWNTIMERLFCDPKNLQVLCKECHRQKTNEENWERSYEN